MAKSIVEQAFGSEQANAYDARWAEFAPMRDALAFLTRMILRDLRPDANILCVGAGTGADLLPLAHAFPGWRFAAVDPSGAMLNVCRKKIDEAGFGSRCVYHEGYLDTFANAEKFDAATSILVSQFLTAREQRREYFRQIADRLVPGGLLVNADLSSTLRPTVSDSLFQLWARTHGANSPEAAQAMLDAWKTAVSVLPPTEVASIIAAGGFEQPTLVYQAMFIHGWYARATGCT